MNNIFLTLKKNIDSIATDILVDILLVIVISLIDTYNLISLFLNQYDDIKESIITALASSTIIYLTVNLIIATIVILSTIILIKSRRKICTYLKDDCFNHIDREFVNTCFIFLSLFILSYSKLPYNNDKFIVSSVVLIVSILYLFIRLIGQLVMQKQKTSSVIASLAQLYKNDNLPYQKFILLEDKETDDDIIGREKINEKLYTICTSEIYGKNITISITGKWGSGKSSILMRLKKSLQKQINNEEILFIDSFQPWLYDNTKSMIFDFSKKIFSKMHYNIDNKELAVFIAEILKTVNNYNITSVLNSTNQEAEATRQREFIEKYLKNNKKKLVIVLDNLERCRIENIINFLKLAKETLFFTNTIFILSYDDEIMNQILSKNEYDRKYLEKFSQLTLAVPEIAPDKMDDITSTCLSNYMLHTGLDEKVVEKIKPHIIEYITTPRELLLAINSIYAGESDHINPTDAIMLNIIKRIAPKIYRIIQNNESHFVFNKSIAYFNQYSNIEQIQTYIDEQYDFFKDLRDNHDTSQEYASCNKLLKYLFKNVEIFSVKRRANYINTLINRDMIDQSVADRRINVTEYFTLYFTQTKNKYTEAADMVDRLIKLPSKDLSKNIIEYIANGSNNTVERFAFDRLREKLGSLDSIKKIDLSNTLTENILNFSQESRGLELSPRQEAYIFLIDVYAVIDDISFERTIEILNSSYKNIEVLHSLEYWGKNSLEKRRVFSMKRYELIKNTLEKMTKRILDGKVNIYSNKNYQRLNVVMLGDESIQAEYINAIKSKITKKNRILIIVDYISKSYSSDGYIYYEINAKQLNKIFTNSEVNEIIKNAHNSPLKNTIREIVKNARESQHVFTQGAKEYKTKTDYNLFELSRQYINNA